MIEANHDSLPRASASPALLAPARERPDCPPTLIRPGMAAKSIYSSPLHRPHPCTLVPAISQNGNPVFQTLCSVSTPWEPGMSPLRLVPAPTDLPELVRIWPANRKSPLTSWNSGTPYLDGSSHLNESGADRVTLFDIPFLPAIVENGLQAH